MDRKRMAAWLGALALVFGSACPKPAPDEDGAVAGARPLQLDRWHRDALDCRRRVRDCADWFVVTVPGEGHVRVDLAKVADEAPIPQFDLVFAEVSGRAIQRASSSGRSRLQQRNPVRAGRHALAVRIPDGASGGMSYELRVRFQPKPVVKPQQFEQVSALVLEIESRPDGGEAVLIDKGQKAGIARGQRGRLLEKGEPIAEIEVIDVYSDGSLAAIVGVLRVPITPSTVAEVDVPL